MYLYILDCGTNNNYKASHVNENLSNWLRYFLSSHRPLAFSCILAFLVHADVVCSLNTVFLKKATNQI